MMARRGLVALLGAALLAGGCGTRVSDDHTRAAAEVESVLRAAQDGSSQVAVPQPAGLVAKEGLAAGSGVGAGTGSATHPERRRSASAPSIGEAPNRTRVPSAGSPPAPPHAGAPVPPPEGSGDVAARSAQAPVAMAPVKIGNIGDYSGVIGAIVGPGAAGMRVAVRAINDDGGLNGHPVQLVVGDAGSDPTRAAYLVKEMVERQGVVAFAGNLWPLSASGARSYLEKNRVPVLGGDLADPVWFDSPAFFPNGPGTPVWSAGAAKMAASAGKPKIAVLWCVESNACSTWHRSIAGEAAGVGAEVVYDAQVSLAQPDYTAECIQARNKGAQAVLAAVEGGSLSRLAQSCKRQDYAPLYITLNLATVPATAKDPNLEGLLTVNPHFPYAADDTTAARKYHEAMARYAPNLEEGPATGSTWAAGALLRLVGRAIPPKPTSADFLAGVWRIKDDNLGGLTVPLSYTEGRPTPSPRCYFVMGVKNGRYVAPQGSRPDCLPSSPSMARN